MPKGNREVLLRFADQALNDFDRVLTNLKNMSDMYGGRNLFEQGDTLPKEKEVPEGYAGQHGEYEKMVDLIAAQTLIAKKFLADFRIKFM